MFPDKTLNYCILDPFALNQKNVLDFLIFFKNFPKIFENIKI